MYFFMIPVALMLWYFAYDAKPIIDPELSYNAEEKNILKRNRLGEILKGF